jgi:hypothetical protein
MMQDQKALILCWGSVEEGNNNIVTSIFAFRDGQYIDYRLTQLKSPFIIDDTRTKILDALLMLIFMRY